MSDALVERLLASDEPSIRYRALTGLLGKTRRSAQVREAMEEVRSSDRVRTLLSKRTAAGTIPGHPYRKWYGSHWVLAALADLGYPPGDESLIPLREQVYGAWLSPTHIRNVPAIEGRPRRCGSQEANAAWALMMLGLHDERTEELIRNLLKWRFPDGGWNCDRRPEADTSSFHETHLPVRALALWGKLQGDEEALEAARQAAEVFLCRRMFRRRRDGVVMTDWFLTLKYPHYWVYDVLAGLRAMAEADLITDPRCEEALDWLESRRLPEGGFPADGRLYRLTARRDGVGWARSLVDWGVVGEGETNDWVTVEALCVLNAAGRLDGCGQRPLTVR
jgi:hypothetical protein